MMVLIQINNYKIQSFDAKTAFLIGELEETICMKIPQGLIEVKGAELTILQADKLANLKF